MRKSAFDAIRKSISKARGLPNARYTNEIIYDEEKHALLFNQWAGLAVVSEVLEPGDAIPTTFLDVPLLLLRDKYGQVHVLQNICRHRGMILIEEPCKISGAIRCPYHS